ncbi:KRAB-A domain-containing protein 2-like [Sipha flava]|uniref:KRAB-A domain-containing protein 2-like n=1 Tax=Sipha flava TaxID=143950 RepID=A0A8B8FR30_9HEMI|nr:KRAB-A domain-containing protein 2-like [Sipha flava]
MVYQDHLTKFVIIRPLRCKRAEEIAYQLLDIFTLFGAPSILHSDNGREFVNKIVTSVCEMWSQVKIVHGKARHSQSQGSIERANQDIESMIATWMETNDNAKWSESLRFVHVMKNSAFHSGIKRSPYEAMFGCTMKMGLATSSIPKNVITELINEDDLIFVLEDSKITISNENEETNTTEKINEDIDIDHNLGKKSILRSTKNDEKTILSKKDKNEKVIEKILLERSNKIKRQ